MPEDWASHMYDDVVNTRRGRDDEYLVLLMSLGQAYSLVSYLGAILTSVNLPDLEYQGAQFTGSLRQ